MKNSLKLLQMLLWLLPLPALAASMTLLNYIDKDEGEPPYPSRILVTAKVMRIDNGDDNGDFALLDRKQKRIYNVTRADKRILRIDEATVDTARPIRWDVREEVDTKSKRVHHVRIYVNEKRCTKLTAFAVEPDAVKALITYRQVLAATQSKTFAAMPSGLQDECDLARDVLEIQREFKYGLPVEVVYNNGRSRRFVDTRKVRLNARLFMLPRGYSETSIQEMRGKLR